MGLIEAVVYGIVQGITEWLPISSTGHLRLLAEVFGHGDPGSGFTAVIQLGTILAVLLYFWADIARATVAWFRSFRDPEVRETPDARLAWGALWGTVPIVLVALLFQDAIEGSLRSLYVVSASLIGFGLVMLWADRALVGKRTMTGIRVLDGIVVGLFQCLALVPGVSRSGSTMVGAFSRGFDRPTAARFSFLLSLPSITAAGLYQLVKHRDEILGQQLAPVLVATAVSFVVGYASIAWLIGFLRKHGLGVFVAYRVVLGLAILALIQAGTLKP